MSMMQILNIALVCANVTKLRKLCYLQDEFIIMFGRIRPRNSSLKKAYLLFGIYFGFILIQVIAIVLGVVLPMLDLIGESQNELRSLIIALIFFWVLSMLLGSYSAIFQGLILHLQLCSNVKMIMKTFDFNEMTGRTVLENASKMFKTITMSSDSLSSQSLILVLNMLIILICQSYLFMDFAQDPANEFGLFQCSQNIFGALASSVALWILNSQSEEIKQSVSKLKNTLGDLEISDGIIQIDGRFHSEAYARGHLTNKLAEFQGLDANGYATLGKPLLTSVFATYITYLIILIQFKMSESSID